MYVKRGVWMTRPESTAGRLNGLLAKKKTGSEVYSYVQPVKGCENYIIISLGTFGYSQYMALLLEMRPNHGKEGNSSWRPSTHTFERESVAG